MILGNSIFQSEVLFNTTTTPATSLPKWTNGSWDDADYDKMTFGLRYWAFDTREWTYKGYTISQKSMKQQQREIGKLFWQKYGTLTTAKDSSGEEIKSMKNYTNLTDINKYTNDNSEDINPDRDAEALAMQRYVDSLVDDDPDDPDESDEDDESDEEDEESGDTEDDDDTEDDEDEEENNTLKYIGFGGAALLGLLVLAKLS